MKPLLALTVLLGLLLPLAAQDGDSSSPRPVLHLLIYNIKHGQGMDGVVDLERQAVVMEQAGADVVALQEVDRLATRSGELDEPVWLAERLGFAHYDFARTLGLNPGDYGNAVISRFPLNDPRRVELGAEGEPRVLELVRLEQPFPLTIGNLHLDHTDEANRIEQIQAVLQAVDEVDGPLILVGDFNARLGGSALNLLQEHGFEHIAKVQEDEGRASPPQRTQPGRRNRDIDHLFVRVGSGLTVREHRFLADAVASDHRPLLAVIAPASDPGAGSSSSPPRSPEVPDTKSNEILDDLLAFSPPRGVSPAPLSRLGPLARGRSEGERSGEGRVDGEPGGGQTVKRGRSGTKATSASCRSAGNSAYRKPNLSPYLVSTLSGTPL